MGICTGGEDRAPTNTLSKLRLKYMGYHLLTALRNVRFYKEQVQGVEE